MLYEFNSYQMHVDDHLFWIAESKALKGCVGQGDDLNEAIAELEMNELEWISTAKEMGIPVPPQTTRISPTYSGKVSLRISPFEHQQASELAKELGISQNQFISDAITNYAANVRQYNRKTLPEYDSVQIINFKDRKQNNILSFKTKLEEM